MSLSERFRILVFAVLVFVWGEALVANGVEAGSESDKPTPTLIERLQGTWVGVAADDVTGNQITITIKGNSFRYDRDADFWFETTFVLLEDKAPMQLHATILRCAESQGKSPIGELVPTIFKLEDGTLTIGAYADVEEPPKGFEDIAASNLYTVRLIPAQTVEGPIP